jgi:hypothetical protein
MAVIVPADMISDVTNFVTALCVRQGMSADGALRAGQEAMAARLFQLRTGSGLETWEFVWPEEGEVEERVMVTLAAPDRRAMDDFAAVKRVR